MRALVVWFFFFVVSWADHNTTHERIGFYIAQGTSTYLPDMPKTWIDPDIIYHFDPTYLFAFSYSNLFKEYENSDFKMGLETVVGLHTGLQEHGEIALAWLFHLARILPDNPWIDADITYGQGLSLALADPLYEEGSERFPQMRYRLQTFLMLDVEGYMIHYEKLRFFARIHHRSGVYDVIAPRGVGSNFIGFGFKVKL